MPGEFLLAAYVPKRAKDNDYDNDDSWITMPHHQANRGVEGGWGGGEGAREHNDDQNLSCKCSDLKAIGAHCQQKC